MSLALFFAVNTALAVPSLAVPGEVIGGAKVVDTTHHSEYHRVVVELPEGHNLVIELAATKEPSGACTHEGLSLQPRWELLESQGVEAPEREDQPEVVTALCTRLAAQSGDYALAPPGKGGMESTTEQGASLHSHGDRPKGKFPSTWIVALLGIILAALLGATALEHKAMRAILGRRQLLELASVTVAGLVARATLGLWTVAWGPFFGFSRLLMMEGNTEPHPLYGAGFGDLSALAVFVFGTSPSDLFTAHLLVGSLLPPLVWWIARNLSPNSPHGPLLAGLLAALLPAHVWLSTTEVMHIDLVTLQALSIATATALVVQAPRSQLTALCLGSASVLSMGITLHIRPESMPFAVIPGLWVMARATSRHRLVLGLGAAGTLAFLMARVLLHLVSVQGKLAPDYNALLTTGPWTALLVPSLTPLTELTYIHTALHARLSTPLLPALALAGLVLLPRRVAIWLGVWWVAMMVPVLPKSWPLADALRLQLPAMLPLTLLAGLGGDRLLDRLPKRLHGHLLGPAIVVLGTLPFTWLARPTWAAHAEARHLFDTIDELESTATVLVDDSGPHIAAFAEWGANARPGTQWRYMSLGLRPPVPTSPLLAWIGTSCHAVPTRKEPVAACRFVLDLCTITPVNTIMVPGESDVHTAILKDNIEVGWYRVDHCAEAAAPEAAAPESAD